MLAKHFGGSMAERHEVRRSGSFLGGLMLGGIMGMMVGAALVHMAERGCPWCEEEEAEECTCGSEESEEKEE